MIHTKDVKEVSLSEIAVMKYVFNICMSFISLFIKVSLVIIVSAIVLWYTSLGMSHLYQINGFSMFYLSGLVTLILSLMFWFFISCFNSVKQLDNGDKISLKIKLKFKTIIKSIFIFKGALFLILLSSWARVSGDDRIDVVVFIFMILSGIEHVINMIFWDEVNIKLNGES